MSKMGYFEYKNIEKIYQAGNTAWKKVIQLFQPLSV